MTVVLTSLDWFIIVLFLLISLGIGLYYTKKASQNTTNFFLGGRNLPWWIAGTSMVATTFAADTPLLITEIVAKNGISGNWLWWNGLIGGMLTTFFFAKYWRKSHILTDVELIEIRYSGKPARFLRGFRAVYLGILMNAVTIAWVNLALATLLEVFFEIPKSQMIWYLAGAMTLVVLYSSLSGFLGVVMTDFIQFGIAMIGTIILAVLVVNSPEIGGISGLKAKLPAETFQFLPQFDFSNQGISNTSNIFLISLGTFLAFVAFQWWASWYPGAEPGGGGYVAQRMMSAKNEKEAVKATLWFQLANYGIRPLPWILVGLSAIALYNLPDNLKDKELLSEIERLEAKDISKKMLVTEKKKIKKASEKDTIIANNYEEIIAVNKKLKSLAKNDEKLNKALIYTDESRKGYVMAMRDFLPSGLKGLLLVAFLAAYMSTISTQLNWGTSYVINDLYKPFIKPKATQKNLVQVSRLATLVLMLVALFVTTQISTLEGAFKFMIEASAGLGGVLILRWYWWRVNAWSEIMATIFPFVALSISTFYLELKFPESLFFTASLTTLAWVMTTFLTKPTNPKVLENFYQKVQPEGFWKPIRESLNIEKQPSKLPYLFVAWISAIFMAYSFLFLLGEFLFQNYQMAGIYTIVFISSLVIMRSFGKKGGSF